MNIFGHLNTPSKVQENYGLLGCMIEEKNISAAFDRNDKIKEKILIKLK